MRVVPDPPRPEDEVYDAHMYCDKSHDERHHFVPVRSARRTVQHLECSYCGERYDHRLHNPPAGYKPH
jgi:hypothetical protein